MSWLSRLFGQKQESAGMAHGAMAAGAKTAVDPVCHMDVDMANPAATSEHEGQTYYFCAVGCKRSFDEDPAKYLGGDAGAHAGHMH